MNSPGVSIFHIDVGKMSKPANTLIKCISGEIGSLYEPQKIVRQARAEAKAKLIQTDNNIKVSELQQRAARRLIQQEELYQTNSERIISDAMPHLDNEARPEEVSRDWYVNFLDKARLVSDEQMQIIWSKILAGEANSPGSFSRRTVNFVQDMDKVEAEAFTLLCGFNFRLKGYHPLIFDESHKIYTENGVDFECLTRLDSIGLISFSSISHLTLGVVREEVVTTYYDKVWKLRIKNHNDNSVEVGKAMLTTVGQELAPISGSKPVHGFTEYVLEQWQDYSPEPVD